MTKPSIDQLIWNQGVSRMETQMVGSIIRFEIMISYSKSFLFLPFYCMNIMEISAQDQSSFTEAYRLGLLQMQTIAE